MVDVIRILCTAAVILANLILLINAPTILAHHPELNNYVIPVAITQILSILCILWRHG
jgi:hypothetical protein